MAKKQKSPEEEEKEEEKKEPTAKLDTACGWLKLNRYYKIQLI